MGTTPLPNLADTDFKLRANTKANRITNNKVSVNWNKFKPLLKKVQRQTRSKYAALYSVRDSRRGKYHYRTTPLRFSPEAVKQADGKLRPFLLKSSRSPNSPLELFLAYIPDSRRAVLELTKWISLRQGTSQIRNKPGLKTANALNSTDEGPEVVYSYPSGPAECGYRLDRIIRYYLGGPPEEGGELIEVVYVYVKRECTVIGGGGGGPGDNDGDTGGGDPDGDGQDIPCNQQIIPGPECDGTCGQSEPPYEPCESGGGSSIPGPQPCETSAEEIGDAFPNASTNVKDELESAISEYGDDFGIDTKEELQHFLAQAGHESGGFTDLSVTENMNYSVQGLLDTFPYLFSQTDLNKADPDDYAGDVEKIGNFVYAKRNGNGNVASGDGYKYRGRGIFQLSQKNNYEAFTNFYQDQFNSTKNFVQNPGLISSDSEIAIMSAMWFYKENVLDRITVNQNTTVDKVTEIVNGPRKNGIKDRKEKFNDVKTYIDDCNK